MDTRIWRRLHWTTWCAIGLAAIVILYSETIPKRFDPQGFNPDEIREFGWPFSWALRTREVDKFYHGDFYKGTKLELPLGLGIIEYHSPVWELRMAGLCADMATGLTVLVAVGFVCTNWRCKSSRLQFSLADLIALTYAVAVMTASYQLATRFAKEEPSTSWMLLAESDFWLTERIEGLAWHLMNRQDSDDPRWHRLPMLFAIACTHYATGLLMLKAIERTVERLSLTPSRSRPAGGD